MNEISKLICKSRRIRCRDLLSIKSSYLLAKGFDFKGRGVVLKTQQHKNVIAFKDVALVREIII